MGQSRAGHQVDRLSVLGGESVEYMKNGGLSFSLDVPDLSPIVHCRFNIHTLPIYGSPKDITRRRISIPLSGCETLKHCQLSGPLT